MTEIIVPQSKSTWLQLRVNDITSTEVAALFGLSPYVTLYELWHRKKNKTVVELEPNERMVWGTRLESSIAYGVAEDNGWQVEPLKCYMRDPKLRAGSSFDFAIGKDGILEIKNVDSMAFKSGWSVDDEGNIEAPPHIELQLAHQLMVSGRSYAFVAALVGGNYVALIKREPDEGITKQIILKINQFWESIDKNIEPSPDFQRDAEFIKSLYQYAEPDKTVESTSDIERLALLYRDAAAIEKEAAEKKEAYKAEILTLISDAEKVKGSSFTISAGMIGPAKVEYERKGYRTFKINWRKEKQQ